MLQKLSIANYAIIEKLDVQLSDSLNIITGETGAGKSIIIGALSLALGQRADGKSLLNKNEKCVVEATFDVGKYDLKCFFRENDLDYDKTLIVRRELTPAGKSRSFVNDTPVNLSVLKELGEQLVNLHSQHETLALNNSLFQLEMVDALVGHEKLLVEFRGKYDGYRSLQAEIESLIAQNQHITDRDYLEFQFKELEEAGLNETEQESLESELKTLENAEEIKGTLDNASGLLQQSDYSVLSQLRALGALLKKVSSFNSSVKDLAARTDSVQIELQDVANEIENLNESITVDPEKMNVLSERLNLLNRLQQKHRTQNIQELLAIKDTLEQKLKSFEVLEKELSEKQGRLETIRKEMEATGEKIHANRNKQKPLIEKEVMSLLKEVGMPNARFEIDIEKLPFEKVTPLGFDKVTFLFSANKGSQLEDLRSVASGGELSRLMLALKSLLAEGVSMPTLIFDEIDTGISGETSIKVGVLLEKLGKSHQVIIITHLPQIARIGDTHFFAYKNDIDDKTVTNLKKLNEKERVIEIAKMIGGEKYSDKALANAKELLLS